MKIFLLIFFIFLFSCSLIKNKKVGNASGTYLLRSNLLYQAYTEKNYSLLHLKKDGSYVLYKSNINFTPVFEQCDTASYGNWSKLTDDIIQITSIDNLNGLVYSIKKEKYGSSDSIYIKVNLNESFDIPINYNIYFNYRSILKSEGNLMTIAKNQLPELFGNYSSYNLGFFILVNPEYYSKRRNIYYDVFKNNESFDISKFNYLNINLPNFNRCFYEFENFNQEFIYFKSDKKLVWMNSIWDKIE